MHLERLKIGFVRIDGDTPLSRRQGILDGFAADKDSRILLMTTGTGAYGSVSIDLFKTAGDTLISTQVESHSRKSHIHLGTTMESKYRDSGHCEGTEAVAEPERQSDSIYC